MIYFDTSALVKRYIDEPGSSYVNHLVSEADYVAVSVLAYPELMSALARKQKARELSDADASKAQNRFEADWRSFLVADFQAELLPLIKETVNRHQLRGADSVHLATALWLKRQTGTDLSFATADIALLQAANHESLPTINPLNAA